MSGGNWTNETMHVSESLTTFSESVASFSKSVALFSKSVAIFPNDVVIIWPELFEIAYCPPFLSWQLHSLRPVLIIFFLYPGDLTD